MPPSLSPMEKLVLEQFRDAVVAIVGSRLERLTLFGSRARGQGDEDSDLDVLVVVQGLLEREKRLLSDAAADLTLEHGLRVAPCVRDASKFDHDAPLARAILRDGVPL